MPELPEVETIRRQLSQSIIGYRIADIWFDNPKALQPNAKAFVKGVRGAVITKIERRAKILQFFLQNNATFIVHLKLTGRLLIRKPSDPKVLYAHVILRLDKDKDKKELRFSDSRKFGYLRFLQLDELKKMLLGFGPEPLSDLTLTKFEAILKKNKKTIKEVLMDQTKISGIGNIYANDALWLAKIDPRTSSQTILPVKVVILFKAVEEVLKEGLKTGGASDQWYLNAYGQKGEYQKYFKVYGKNGKPCSRCGTIIKRIVIGSRGTFYCPKCQGG